MGTCHPRESLIIHKVEGWEIGNLLLLERDGLYAICWEWAHDDYKEKWFEEWYTMEELVYSAVTHDKDHWASEQHEMVRFIRGYVGEEQWALAVLENL